MCIKKMLNPKKKKKRKDPVYNTKNFFYAIPKSFVWSMLMLYFSSV